MEFHIRFTRQGVAVKFSREKEPPKGFVTAVGHDTGENIDGGINLTTAPVKIGDEVFSALHVSTYEPQQQPAHYAEQHRKRVMLNMPDATVSELVEKLIQEKQAAAYAVETIFGCRRGTNGHKLLDDGTSQIPWKVYMILFAANNTELLRVVAKEHEWKLQGIRPSGAAIEVFPSEWLVFSDTAWHELCNELFSVTTP
jgi:hypothetical protein